MIKRLALVLCVLFSLGACAAFDTNPEPYLGFDPDEVPIIPGGSIGIYSGYYAGTMTLDSNSCAGVSDEMGAAIDCSLDVVHVDETLNVTLGDGTIVAGTLDVDKAILMEQADTTKRVFYLDFSTADAVSGSMEVIEASGDGSYGAPCASYTLSLAKGEKPADDEAAAEGDEALQGPFGLRAQKR